MLFSPSKFSSILHKVGKSITLFLNDFIAMLLPFLIDKQTFFIS
ncbi:hypothetical protein predicted by Glimmer/Critica [Bartonella tribocorum CIP 105476]|uniref:Uncharacterized protein n=1 Tax=Bartonella tribocorum (strain DSM 28219 / CCUG 45778 / CIP 105476 / IBS 506) TaxID=382640 RepID=A9IXD2_BART1|nr:hypothetical protein predicted by Glimmer/Critica [Bartonella tribocorum CIP 105476]